ncbi:MAG: hypothetical protein ACRC50_06895 [Gaiella sp.]
MTGAQALRRRLEAPRAAGIAGLVFAALFVGAILLLRVRPPSGASEDEVAAWYLRDNATRVALVGLYVVPFAGIAFLWFLAVIRHHVSEREDRFFDTVLLGSGLLFVAMLWTSAAVAGSLVSGVRFLDATPPSPDVVEGIRSLGHTLFYVYALRAAAVFMVITSVRARRVGALPGWLSIAGVVIAVALLLGVSFLPIMSLLFPTWVAALSIVVLTQPRRAASLG